MYLDQTMQALTPTFTFVNFGCSAKTIIIANDDINGLNKVQFSYYGQVVDGTLPYAQQVSLDVTTGNGIYLRYVNGAPAYRLMVKGN